MHPAPHRSTLFPYTTLFRSALEQLKAQKNVDAKKLGAVGFCFGGTTVLELARSGSPINGVVSIHGGLAPLKSEAPKEVKAKRSEEHTSELQSHSDLVCRLLL